MTTIMRENESAIHNAIQDLKDSIFGLKQPFSVMGIISDTEHGPTIDSEKLSPFISELENIAKTLPDHDDGIERVLKQFWIVAIKFLIVSCREEDWNFQSIKKLAGAVEKADVETDSVFDILISDARHDLSMAYPGDEEFWALYREFSLGIIDCDTNKFLLLNKHTLERYIDNHLLNTLESPEATNQIISQIERCARHTQFVVKRFSESGGHHG